MEIEEIETFHVAHEYETSLGGSRGRTDTRSTVLVRVRTDTDVTGWGEAFAFPGAVTAIIDDILAPEIVGHSPGQVVSLAERVYTGDIGGYHIGRGPLMQSALAGIEIALWDIRGKVTDTPIHELLSGPSRRSIVPYASTMYFSDAIDDLEQPIQRAVEEGFKAAKIKLGGGYENDRERVRIARELLPHNAHLMVDYNGNYTPRQAIKSIKKIDEYDITWAEEPIPPENISGYQELKQRIDIPLAAGEAHAGRFEFNRLIQERAVDIIQPNVCKCGGLSEARFIARLATTENVLVRPHVWNSAIGTVAALHFAAALPSYPHHTGNAPEPVLFEVDRSDNPLRSKLLDRSFEPSDGEISVPDDPGLGISVNESVLNQYLQND